LEVAGSLIAVSSVDATIRTDMGAVVGAAAKTPVGFMR